jgi:hypothetical protein
MYINNRLYLRTQAIEMDMVKVSLYVLALSCAGMSVLVLVSVVMHVLDQCCKKRPAKAQWIQMKRRPNEPDVLSNQTYV